MNDPQKSKYFTQRILCKTLAGNNIYVLTITNPCQNQGDGNVVGNSFFLNFYTNTKLLLTETIFYSMMVEVDPYWCWMCLEDIKLL